MRQAADGQVFASHYMRVHDALSRHASVAIMTLVALFATAAAGLGSLNLDLSFRPLFASGEEIAAPTEAFERVFGQSSGAWIVAVLENQGKSPAGFLRETARLSDRVRQIPGVSEVLSLPGLRIPDWRDGKLSAVAAVPEYLLDPLEQGDLEQQFASLLDGTRFVNWLVSADGTRLLLAARLAPRIDDLDARRDIVDGFQQVVRGESSGDIRVYFSGVSVVEVAYERQLLIDQLTATAIATFALALLLYWTFSGFRAVLLCLGPVAAAVPATLGVMGWMQQPVTIINTAIPLVILVIGVADAVHMLTAWLSARSAGADRRVATRQMLLLTGKACFYTTVTTAGGFLALCSAELLSVRNFGLCAAIGIVFAWLANQVMLPWLLRRVDAGRVLSESLANRVADRTVASLIRLAASRPKAIIAGSVFSAVGCLVLLPSLEVDQRFNGELPATHPVTRAQAILETDFGGFLGPEISIRRDDGGSMVDDASLHDLRRFVAAIRALPETQHVWSVLDLLPRRVTADERPTVLDALRASPVFAGRVTELVNARGDRLAIVVRIGDVGTTMAAIYREDLLRLAREKLGTGYDVQLVGQWWLAQHGMHLILHDMLASLAAAMLIVLPLVWLALRDWRLMLAATIANLLPLLLPLAFMAASGISLRIGTAVVLAIALGIIVDNTMHISLRLRTSLTAGTDFRQSLGAAITVTGRALVFTTLALIGGFLSMLSNELLAIRDMGLVGAVTILGAMLADFLLLPAILAANPRKISHIDGAPRPGGEACHPAARCRPGEFSPVESRSSRHGNAEKKFIKAG